MKWRLAILLMMLAALGAGFWLLRNYDFQTLAQLEPRVLAYLFIASLLYSWLYGLGVTLVLRSVGAVRGAWRVFLVISGGGTASYLGNVQLGIPIRLFLFDRLLCIPVAIGTASVALESAIWFGLMGLGLILAGAPSNLAPWLAAAALPAGVAAAYTVALPLASRVAHKIPDRWGKLPLTRLRGWMVELIAALRQARPGWLLGAVLLFACNYLIDAGTIWLLLISLGEQIDLWDALAAIILSYLAGLVSLVPMGLGVREISMVALLSKSGVSPEAATTAALVLRSLRTIIPLAIGLLAVNLLGIRLLMRQADSTSNTPGGAP